MLTDVSESLRKWGQAFQVVLISFFSPYLSLSYALVHFISALSPAECRDINLLSLAVRVRWFGWVRLDPVNVCYEYSSVAYVIIHFNGRKLREKYITPLVLLVKGKSIWNARSSCFSADGSILKMHQDPERGSLQLQFIIIPLGSIKEHFCRYTQSLAAPVGSFQLLN